MRRKRIIFGVRGCVTIMRVCVQEIKKCSFRNLEFGICVSFVINWPENGNFKRECECRARVSLLRDFAKSVGLVEISR